MPMSNDTVERSRQDNRPATSRRNANQFCVLQNLDKCFFYLFVFLNFNLRTENCVIPLRTDADIVDENLSFSSCLRQLQEFLQFSFLGHRLFHRLPQFL